MKDNFFKKIKYFFVFALVVLVAGMALLGILGFNQPVDYANNYELHISVDQSTKNEKEVIIEISDTGKGIENVEIAKQPLYTTKANLERSGMGFTIMESFMDDVEVESVFSHSEEEADNAGDSVAVG